MKTISMWQPWASLVALEMKLIETRGWRTPYRGDLAIHATKKWTIDFASLARECDLPEELPLGAIVCVVELYDVVGAVDLRTNGMLTERERQFGDYAVGRYGWMFRNVRKLATPIPYKGAQGFFEVPDELFEGVLP